MDKYLKRISTGLFALLIAAGLAFGGSQALSTTVVSECDSAGEVAECPPYDDQSCDELCHELYMTDGACNPDGCCLCQI